VANNEIGTVQPIAEIGAVVKERASSSTATRCRHRQAAFDVEQMKVDLVSISAHKFYGPKGIGALWVRRKRACASRPSSTAAARARHAQRTLNVPAIVGSARRRRSRSARWPRRGCAPESFAQLQDYLFSHLDHLS